MSTVKDQVEAYVAYKNGLGVPMVSEASALRQFARYADSVGHDGPITVDVAAGGPEAAHYAEATIKTVRNGAAGARVRLRAGGRSSSLPPGLIGKSSKSHNTLHLHRRGGVADRPRRIEALRAAGPDEAPRVQHGDSAAQVHGMPQRGALLDDSNVTGSVGTPSEAAANAAGSSWRTATSRFASGTSSIRFARSGACCFAEERYGSGGLRGYTTCATPTQ